MEGDVAVTQEIVEVFFATLSGIRAELEACLVSDVPGAIGRAAHKTKGMLLALGARRAAGQASQLEMAAKTGLVGAARDQALGLASELDQVAAELSRWMTSVDVAPAPGGQRRER